LSVVADIETLMGDQGEGKNARRKTRSQKHGVGKSQRGEGGLELNGDIE
jgi:hypothetical protein